MDYYTGVDIGTSSTKAVAFSADGKVLAQHAVHYPIHHPRENYSEQDPMEILAATVTCLSSIALQLPQCNPVLVSFSAAMHSLILMDKNHGPLTNCIIWADNRAGELAAALRSTPQGLSFYHISGVPIHAMSPFCKLQWFAENEPLLFNQTEKFIGIKEFIYLKLFDTCVVDTGIASATGLLNIKTLQWDDGILAYCGIGIGQLSQLVSTVYTSHLPAPAASNFSGQLTAFNKTAFIIGSSDGALANLGSGATGEGTACVTIGTSSAVRIVTNIPFTDIGMRTFCYHLSGNKYIIGGASNNGAVIIQWLKETVLQNKDTYDEFIALAAPVKPGCDGLLMLPYLLGERAPLWNADARGIFWGLDIKHTAAQMLRAAMEAVVCNVFNIASILMEKAIVTTVYANGGFAESNDWVQMLSDVFNLAVVVPAMQESPAYGAVILGMEAMDIPVENNNAVRTFSPNTANHETYLSQAKKMERLYELVKAEF